MTSVSTKANMINCTSHTPLEFFCNLTQTVYEIDEFDFDTILNAPDGWTKLADLWDRYLIKYDLYVFHYAVSHIKYGCDIGDSASDITSLIKAICIELCSDSTAGCAWRAHRLFRRALREAEPENDNDFRNRLYSENGLGLSLQHCEYLDKRMMLRYWTAKGVCKNKCNAASNYIRKYEKLLTALCPTLSAWESSRWIDIENIYTALQDETGYSHRISPEEYDILITLFRMKTSSYKLTYDKNLDILRCMGNLRYFSMNWAKVLWPTDTHSKIVNTFCLIAERARVLSSDEVLREDILRPCYLLDTEYDVLSSSWLYSVVQNWSSNNEINSRFAKATKKALFETSLKL